MFCKKCGARIPDDHTRFCPSCGEPIIREKAGPSRTEKILWIVIGIIILIAAFSLLKNTSPVRSTNQISTPQMNVNSTQKSGLKSRPRIRREVSPPPPAPASTVSPGQTPSSILYSSLTKALAGTRYTIEIRYVHRKKAFRVSASIIYDNQSRETYLDIFSRFFAISYGDRTRPLIVADISLKQDNGKVMMSMGIGRKVANSVPPVTWRQFSGMGPSLLNWVQNHTVSNPPSPEMACYFKQNEKF
ncbi:MAG: zinc ribbon domain-containing protein [Acidobacteria bacterium]|nr:zinc ribbon domain-containing protein [Acidobacteriota bacterium]